MMRTLARAIPLVVISLALAAPAGATTTLNGTFQAHFGRGRGAPTGSCAPNTFCGPGTLTGFGQGTQTTEFTSFEPIEGTFCADVTLVQTIVVASGTLVLDETGTFCSPGRSEAAPASPSHYGHPHLVEVTFTVDGAASSGAFAGATGTGTESVVIAGDVGVSTLSGTINLG